MEKVTLASSGVIVRLATPYDIDGIRKIAKPNRQQIGTIDILDLSDSIEQESVVVAEYMKYIIGFIHWTRERGYAFIHQLCVDERFRRRGIAELLFFEAPSPKRWRCYADNNDGNAFFEKMKGVIIGGSFSNGRPVHLYEKSPE